MKSITQHAVEIKAEFGDVLNGRIEAGQRLALTGAVKQNGPDSYEVASQSEPGQVYQVSWAGAWSCTCKDFDGTGYHPAPTVAAFGDATCRPCKHIVACALVYFSGEQPAPIAADLVIVTRRVVKFAGQTQSNDGKILWWKKAGEETVTPRITRRLSDSEIRTRLLNYELIKQDCATTEIWHYYRRLSDAQVKQRRDSALPVTPSGSINDYLGY